MSIKEYDLSVFINDLIGGRYDHFTKLELASKLTSLLPDCTSKMTLQIQIVRALKLDDTVIGSRTGKGE